MRGLLVLALLSGCPKPTPEAPLPTVDPRELLARATAEAPPGASAATFDLRVESPEQNVNANGALVVSPPDRFRVEVRGPIGGPALVVVSDGTRLRAWLASKNELLTADTADAVIAGYTGGEVGLEALASLLLGRLPTLRAPDLVRPETIPSYRWVGPAQSHLDVALDPRSGHLAGFGLVDELGAELLSADVAGGEAWPTKLVARVPRKGIVATFEFDEWRPAAPPDSAFVLEPEGAVVKPLELGAPE